MTSPASHRRRAEELLAMGLQSRDKAAEMASNGERHFEDMDEWVAAVSIAQKDAELLISAAAVHAVLANRE